MGSVELYNVRKNFGSFEAIKGVDLKIDDGEFAVLVGPSGCGKSTLLRIIAGLEDASGGEIRIGERPVNDLKPRQRNIAMVFQSYALYPHMTAHDNMAFNLKLSKVPKPGIIERVTGTSRMLGLEALLGRRPGQLSGGQRQRVAMGRAIIRDPAVYLFDEPLSNLDAKLRVQMRGEIKMLHQNVGTTAIYVTHDQIEAMTLANRIVVLNNGRIEQIGSPLELYRRPQNIFVAGFIGSPAMNFIDAVTAAGEGNRPLARFADGTALDLDPELSVRLGQEVVIGLRPENLVRNGGGAQLSGRVSLVEPTGAQTHLTAEFGKQSLVTIVDGSEDVRFQEALTVGILPEHIHVFDKSTGARIT